MIPFSSRSVATATLVFVALAVSACSGASGAGRIASASLDMTVRVWSESGDELETVDVESAPTVIISLADDELRFAESRGAQRTVGFDGNSSSSSGFELVTDAILEDSDVRAGSEVALSADAINDVLGGFRDGTTLPGIQALAALEPDLVVVSVGAGWVILNTER